MKVGKFEPITRWPVIEGKLSVALLLSDLKEVKELSLVFKKLGVIPHFYEDLKTFWNGTLERMPALCIVDVKMMSEDELVLAHHPAVIAEEMPLLFFYTEKTEPLLVSTHQFYHLGTLKKSHDYEGPLKALLKRLNKVASLEQHFHMLKVTTKAQKDQIEKLELALRDDRTADNYRSMVKSVCMQFEELRLETDFFKSIERVFQSTEEIDEFAFLELSFNGQKLISPISNAEKFRSIPSLWLGQVCKNGIELFAQNMATQVAVDVMGGDLVSLLIRGHEKKPDKLIFIKSQNELFFNNFDWNLLEAYLSGLYATYRSQVSAPIVPEVKYNSVFEALSHLDQYLFGQARNEESVVKLKDLKCLNLDLSSLVKQVVKKGNRRFYWNHFMMDFIHKLQIQSRIEFRYFECGVMNIGFTVESKYADIFFDQLKDFSQRFQYWKYFDEDTGVLALSISPKVTMSPLSAHAYLTKVLGVEQEVVEEEREKIQQRLQKSPVSKPIVTMNNKDKKAWSFVQPKGEMDI